MEIVENLNAQKEMTMTQVGILKNLTKKGWVSLNLVYLNSYYDN